MVPHNPRRIVWRLTLAAAWRRCWQSTLCWWWTYYLHSTWTPQDGCAADLVGADWSSRLWTKTIWSTKACKRKEASTHSKKDKKETIISGLPLKRTPPSDATTLRPSNLPAPKLIHFSKLCDALKVHCLISLLFFFSWRCKYVLHMH